MKRQLPNHAADVKQLALVDVLMDALAIRHRSGGLRVNSILQVKSNRSSGLVLAD